MVLTKLSLFSGIGGDDLASDAAGIETVCFVERDKYCQQVLKKHWPDIPIIEDVKNVTKETLAHTYNGRQSRNMGKALSGRETTSLTDTEPCSGSESEVPIREIDIIAGGFPCQPHSVAGKRKGSSDERNLWPEVRRILGEFKPRWFVGENVPGLFTSDGGRFFNGIVSDLAALGYAVGWCTYGAVDVGALHRRNRVFIVGYSNGSGNTQSRLQQSDILTKSSQDVSYTTGIGSTSRLSEQAQRQEGVSRESINSSEEYSNPKCQSYRDGGYDSSPVLRNRKKGQVSIFGTTKPGLGRVVDGLSYWLDEPAGIPRVATGIKNRVNRLKGLGNAVVPQQIYLVYKAIADIESK